MNQRPADFFLFHHYIDDDYATAHTVHGVVDETVCQLQHTMYLL